MVANSWEGISSYAKSVGAKFPELVAAQWALESSWGKIVSGKNNFFGLKSIKSQASSSHLTQEFINGQWLTITDGFIDFPSPEACIDYLVRLWYKDFEGYKGVNNAKDTDAAAHMLKEQGYATDPSYPTKLYWPHEPRTLQSCKKIQLTNAPKYYNEEYHSIAAWNLAARTFDFLKTR
jgi:Muramidase (flagellum-specific)